jgi:hypothetical protein
LSKDGQLNIHITAAKPASLFGSENWILKSKDKRGRHGI